MTGRQEHNNAIEARIAKRLKHAPKILKEYSYNFGGKTETTKDVYLRYVADFLNYYKTADIFSLKKKDINQYMESIRFREDGTERGASWRNAVLAGIRDFYQFLVDNEMIENNPCASIKPPREKGEKEVVAMTVDEIKQVQRNILMGVGSARARTTQAKWRNRDMAIILLGCTTGLRVSAITEINVEDIDFANQTIRVIEKGNKYRVINVGDKTIEALKAWKADRDEMIEDESDAFFISSRKSRISQKTIARLIEHYTENLDKHITPHKMRSSCATNLYEQTGDIYLVQDVLGHKNIANTRRYAKVGEARRKEAAAILDGLV